MKYRYICIFQLTGTVYISMYVVELSFGICCCETDGSRGTVTKWCFTSPWWKKCTHWHSMMLAEYLWRPNSGCKYNEVLHGAFQQWWQWCEGQATFQVPMQISTSVACKLLSIGGENEYLVLVTMLKDSVLYPRICSTEQCSCAFCICCSFNGNK